jgi:hypothetical protein
MNGGILRGRPRPGRGCSAIDGMEWNGMSPANAVCASYTSGHVFDTTNLVSLTYIFVQRYTVHFNTKRPTNFDIILTGI